MTLRGTIFKTQVYHVLQGGDSMSHDGYGSTQNRGVLELHTTVSFHFLAVWDISTVKPVLRDHSGENAKVVSYSRWSFNTGSMIQLKNNVVIDRCYSTTS
jgi:hypothetical protein